MLATFATCPTAATAASHPSPPPPHTRTRTYTFVVMVKHLCLVEIHLLRIHRAATAQAAVQTASIDICIGS